MSKKQSSKKELYQLEVADRDSARKRESEIKKSGGQDWMMFVTGLVGLLSFMFIIYAVVYIPSVLENDLFVHLMGDDRRGCDKQHLRLLLRDIIR
jgi:uncharacterized protein YqhQ